MPEQTIIAELKQQLRAKFPDAHKQTTSDGTTKEGSTDPTPDVIRQHCLQIQSEWSDVERQKRQCKETHDTGNVPYDHSEAG